MITFPRPGTETYRAPQWTTETLKAELEYLQRERLASIEADNDRTPGSIAWCEHKLELILSELERRKRLYRRHRGDPMAPRWSDGGTRDRDDLIGLAKDLKHAWPIDRFLTELMQVRLIPAGRGRWRCRCFTGAHRDDSPSMMVYGSDGHVHCHACGYHGDLYDVTRLYFGLTSFADAVRKVADASTSGGEAA